MRPGEEQLRYYAARFRDLMEPVWEVEIADPANRWYSDGPEYPALFRFREEEEARGPQA